MDALSEPDIAQKVNIYGTHGSTMDYALENFDRSVEKFRAMLEDD